MSKQATLTKVQPAVSEIEPAEYEAVLESLDSITETDLGFCSVRSGLNPAGCLVTLLNTFDGKFAVISSIPSF